jgi:hypothetical protein
VLRGKPKGHNTVQRLKLDSQQPAIRQFVRKLRPKREGLELEFEGEVVCRVFPPDFEPPLDQAQAREQIRALMRKSQERNKGVPARVLEREIREAIDEVRGRRKQ